MAFEKLSKMEVAVFRNVINRSATGREALKGELLVKLNNELEPDPNKERDLNFLTRVKKLLNDPRAAPDWCWTRMRCCFFTTSGSRLRQDLKYITHSLHIKLADLMKIQSADPLQSDPVLSRDPEQYFARAKTALENLSSIPTDDQATLQNLRHTKRVSVYNLIKYVESMLALPDDALTWQAFSKMRDAITNIHGHINIILNDGALINVLSYRIDHRQAEIYFKSLSDFHKPNIMTVNHPNPSAFVDDIKSTYDLLAINREPTRLAIVALNRARCEADARQSTLYSFHAPMARTLGIADNSPGSPDPVPRASSPQAEPINIHTDSNVAMDLARVKAIFINMAHEWFEMSIFRFSNVKDAVREVTEKEDGSDRSRMEWDFTGVREFLGDIKYQKQRPLVPDMISHADGHALEAVRYPRTRRFLPANVRKDSGQHSDLGIKIAEQKASMCKVNNNPLTNAWFFRKVAQLLALLFDTKSAVGTPFDKVESEQIQTIIDKCNEQTKLPSILVPENFPNLVAREHNNAAPVGAPPSPRR